MGKKESIGTFKCCSDGKELSCYYCISCRVILHRSCVERKKGTIYIGGNKIYCGKNCEEVALDRMTSAEQDLIIELREIISELQTELKQKNNAIEKQRRSSVAFENDVAEAESEYKSQIDDYENKIKILEDGLAEQIKKSKGLKDDLEQTRKCCDQIKQELKITSGELEQKLQNAKAQIQDYKEKESRHLENIFNKEEEIIENQRKIKEISIENDNIKLLLETKEVDEIRDLKDRLMVQLEKEKRTLELNQKSEKQLKDELQEYKNKFSRMKAYVESLKRQKEKRSSVTSERDAAEVENPHNQESRNLKERIKLMEQQLRDEEEKTREYSNDLNTRHAEQRETYERDTAELRMKVRSLEAQLKREKDENKAKISDIHNQHREQLENLKKSTAASNTKYSEIEDHETQTDPENIQSQNKTQEECEAKIKRLENDLQSIRERLRRENENSFNQMESCKTTITDLKAKLGRANVLNEGFKKSVEVIERKKRDLEEQLQKLKNNPAINRTTHECSSLKRPQGKVQENRKTKEAKTRIPQVFFLGGCDIYNVGKIFKSISGNSFDTICQYSKSNHLDDFLLSHQALSNKLNKEDFKVIFTTSEHLRRGRSIKASEIENFVQLSRNTNLYVVGAPLVLNKPVLNRFIREQNRMISDIVGNSFIDCNDIIGNHDIEESGTFKYNAKWTILECVHQKILQHIKNITRKSNYTQDKQHSADNNKMIQRKPTKHVGIQVALNHCEEMANRPREHQQQNNFLYLQAKPNQDKIQTNNLRHISEENAPRTSTGATKKHRTADPLALQSFLYPGAPPGTTSQTHTDAIYRFT